MIRTAEGDNSEARCFYQKRLGLTCGPPQKRTLRGQGSWGIAGTFLQQT